MPLPTPLAPISGPWYHCGVQITGYIRASCSVFRVFSITLLRAKMHEKILEFSSGHQIDDVLESAVGFAVGLFDGRGWWRLGSGFVNKGRGRQGAVEAFA